MHTNSNAIDLFVAALLLNAKFPPEMLIFCSVFSNPYICIMRHLSIAETHAFFGIKMYTESVLLSL